MVNEKFRERVFAWNCFREQNTAQFPDFFDNVLKLCLNKSKPVDLSFQEQSILIKFLDNCVNSLEIDLIRAQVQKICGLPMWVSLSANRREAEFKNFAKLRKFWKAVEKNDAKLSQADKDRAMFERTFFKSLIANFLDIIKANYYNKTNQDEEMEVGEIPIDELNQSQGQAEANTRKDYRLHYLERFMELLIDLEALLPTRRFFNTLLDDTNLLIHCFLSDLVQTERFDSKSSAKQSWEASSDAKLDKYNLFKQLFKTLKFYTTFEIDDQSGEAKSDAQVKEDHYDKLKQLQKGVFKYFREDLHSFCLTNIATIDKRETLIRHLESLAEDRLYSLAEYLHLVPGVADNQASSYSKKLLIEIIIWHMERRMSQLDELNSMPLYPTEEIIWNENLVPNEFKQQATTDTCLSLPKLNLQFLTLHDYLLRNFNLFRLESAYELRQDIEDACIRLKPYYSYEEQTVAFGSWSRMAQPVNSFSLIEVAKPSVGELAPSRVRADVTIDLEMLREDVRAEWSSLRKHDIGFLVSLKPRNTPEQRYNAADSFLSQMGAVSVRGCELEGVINEDGKLIGEDVNQQKQKFEGFNRTYRVLLDSNQYKMDSDKLAANEIKEDVYSSFNVFVRRRPKENNFKAVLECIRDLMNTNFVVPDWLRDLILGYGDPKAAHYREMKQPRAIAVLDFNDTFLSYEHLVESFPGYEVELKSPSGDVRPPFKVTFNELLKSSQEDEQENMSKIVF
jgi:intron-binding protein aquarius